MSEYTPTTYEVRAGYEERFLDGAAEFDRWLYEREAGAAKAERERIVGLLETRLDDCYEKNDMGGWSFMPNRFISFIEEEGNDSV